MTPTKTTAGVRLSMSILESRDVVAGAGIRTNRDQMSVTLALLGR